MMDNSREEIHFSFDGRKLVAQPGEVLAAALLRNGIKIFGRSIKYHRPRGILCARGYCFQCAVTVNGIPNVPACQVKVEEGMNVRSQNSYPNAQHDLLGVLDKFSRFMPVGFYYRITRPRFFLPYYLRLLRKFTGTANLPEIPLRKEYKHHLLKPEVLVIGGGPAGWVAALTCASSKEVLLIDEEESLGGHLRFLSSYLIEGDHIDNDNSPKETIHRLTQLSDKVKNLQILRSCSVVGVYHSGPDVELLAISEENLYIIHPKEIIVATGAYERVPLFENNDLPGIVTADAVLTIINQWNILPGKQAVILGMTRHGIHALYNLLDRGIEVKAVILEPQDNRFLRVLQKIAPEINIFTGWHLERAIGGKELKGVFIAKDGKRRRLNVDLLVACGSLIPRYEIPRLLGWEVRYSHGKRIFTLEQSSESLGTVIGMASGCVATGEAYLDGLISCSSDDKKESLVAQLQEVRNSIIEYNKGDWNE